MRKMFGAVFASTLVLVLVLVLLTAGSALAYSQKVAPLPLSPGYTLEGANFYLMTSWDKDAGKPVRGCFTVSMFSGGSAQHEFTIGPKDLKAGSIKTLVPGYYPSSSITKVEVVLYDRQGRQGYASTTY